MPLCLEVHELAPGGAEALEAAVWEVSESHCILAGTMLVDTSVSPAYLLSHLRRALEREDLSGSLLVAEVGDGLHSAGLDPAIQEWLQASLIIAGD